jgi:hypothetical protein
MHKTVILLGVLPGRDTWSLTFKDGHRLRVMSRIFSPTKEVTGSDRKLEKKYVKRSSKLLHINRYY